MSRKKGPLGRRTSRAIAGDAIDLLGSPPAQHKYRPDLLEVPYFVPLPITDQFWKDFRHASEHDKRRILKQWLANRECAPDNTEAARVLDEQIGQLTAALATSLPPGLDSHAPSIHSPAGKGAEKEAVVVQRAAALAAFRESCRRKGVKLTDKMLAKAAKETWNDRTMVTWWKRNDPKCTPPHDRLIQSVLKKDPLSIWQPNIRSRRQPE